MHTHRYRITITGMVIRARDYNTLSLLPQSGHCRPGPEVLRVWENKSNRIWNTHSIYVSWWNPLLISWSITSALGWVGSENKAPNCLAPRAEKFPPLRSFLNLMNYWNPHKHLRVTQPKGGKDWFFLRTILIIPVNRFFVLVQTWVPSEYSYSLGERIVNVCKRKRNSKLKNCWRKNTLLAKDTSYNSCHVNHAKIHTVITRYVCLDAGFSEK